MDIDEETAGSGLAHCTLSKQATRLLLDADEPAPLFIDWGGCPVILQTQGNILSSQPQQFGVKDVLRHMQN